MISRKDFLILTGAAVLVPPFSRASEESLALLDHIILGCNDLDVGIRFVQERTGVRAAPGGIFKPGLSFTYLSWVIRSPALCTPGVRVFTFGVQLAV